MAHFLEHNLAHLLDGWNLLQRADRAGHQQGLLQSLSAASKLLAALLLIAGTVISTNVAAICAVFVLTVGVTIFSSNGLLLLMRIVWVSVFSFTGIMSLPALFLTPGPTLLRIPFTGWSLSETGLHTFLLLLMRAETAATISLAVILTTPWPRLLAGLRALRVPALLVALIGATYRYVILLLESAREMMQSRRSRLVGPLPPKERRRLLIATGGVLFSKSEALSQEVHDAMISRGFRGEVRLLASDRYQARDGVAVAIGALVAAALMIWR